jgi:two-component system sensor histidine kinase RpfC
MSHEIRTPMNGVLGTLDLLEANTSHDPQSRRLVRIAHSSATSLLRIINDVLDLSKLEANQVEVNAVPFDLHRELNEIINTHRARALEKELGLELLIDPRLPSHLTGDVRLLRQALGNLLSNAVKFTRRGHVALTAIKVGGDGDAVTVRFDTEDSGVGLTEEQQQRVFNRFAQVHGQEVGGTQGTGLGTTIAKQLVEAMGGRIELRSMPGVGSVFTVTLSFAVPKHQPAPSDLRPGGELVIRTSDHRVASTLGEWAASWGVRTIWQGATRPPPCRGTGFRAYVYDAAHANEITEGARQHDDSGQVATYLLDFEPTPGARIMGLHLDQGQVFRALRALEQGRLDLEEDPAEPSLELAAEALGNAAPAVPLHVLVVEDNAINKEVLALTLKSLGHSVTAVDDGELALEALEHDDFDVCLLDHQLGAVSGLDILKTYRMVCAQDPTVAPVPIIMLTASATAELRDAALTAGADNYLTKPATRLQLEQAMRAAVSMRRPAHPATQDGPELVSDHVDTPARRGLNRASYAELAETIGAVNARQLLEYFVTSAHEYLQRAEGALENDDTATFLGTAHALKGNAGYLGCEAVEQAAAMAQAAAEAPGFVLRTQGRAVFQAMRLALRETEEAVLALQPLAPQAGVISLAQRRRNAS